MTNRQEVVCQGLILRVIKYRDNQAIIRVLTPELGVIQCSIRNLNRKKDNLLGVISNLNYLNIELVKIVNNDIYILRNAHLISTLADTNNYETFKYQSAGAELFTKIDIYLEEDYPVLFKLLLTFLSYLTKVEKNQVAIFWRFLLHYYHLLGIPLSLQKCSECNKAFHNSYSYSLENNGLICTQCSLEQKNIPISHEAQLLLLKLPSIGNYIQDIFVSDQTKKEINELFITHLSLSLHKDIKLQSLEI